MKGDIRRDYRQVIHQKLENTAADAAHEMPSTNTETNWQKGEGKRSDFETRNTRSNEKSFETAEMYYQNGVKTYVP